MYPCPKYSWSTGSCSTCFRTGGIGITAFWPTAFGQKRSHCAVNYWKERRLRPKNNPLKSLLFPGSRLQSVPPVAMPRFTGRRNCPPAGSDFLLLLRYVPRCRLPNSGRSVTHHELSGRESVRCFDLFSRSVSVGVCAGDGYLSREPRTTILATTIRRSGLSRYLSERSRREKTSAIIEKTERCFHPAGIQSP